VTTAPALAETSGYYFANCNPVVPDLRMLDSTQAEQLWKVSEELTAGYLYNKPSA
jgi:hypothetical protein